MLPWIRTRRRTILADQWICLHADECQLPTGALIEPYYVLEEKEWVHVIALNQNDEILLIRQYRYAANIFATELPGGFVDSGETPLDAAKRELAEETGHTSLDWTPLPALFVNPARQTNRVHTFIARNVRHTQNAAPEPSESIISIEFAAAAEVLNRIRSAEFSQALHVASFYLALQHTGHFAPA